VVTPIANITSADQVLAVVGYYIYNYLFITKFQLPTNSGWQLLQKSLIPVQENLVL